MNHHCNDGLVSDYGSPSFDGLNGLDSPTVSHYKLPSHLKYTDHTTISSSSGSSQSSASVSGIDLPMKSEEDLRRKRRRERNKVAATKCRHKKKQHVIQLNIDLARLESSNAIMKNTMAELKAEVNRLTDMLTVHKPYCKMNMKTESPIEVDQNNNHTLIQPLFSDLSDLPEEKPQYLYHEYRDHQYVHQEDQNKKLQYHHQYPYHNCNHYHQYGLNQPMDPNLQSTQHFQEHEQPNYFYEADQHWHVWGGT